jgi:hypothetical protein
MPLSCKKFDGVQAAACFTVVNTPRPWRRAARKSRRQPASFAGPSHARGCLSARGRSPRAVQWLLKGEQRPLAQRLSTGSNGEACQIAARTGQLASVTLRRRVECFLPRPRRSPVIRRASTREDDDSFAEVAAADVRRHRRLVLRRCGSSGHASGRSGTSHHRGGRPGRSGSISAESSPPKVDSRPLYAQTETAGDRPDREIAFEEGFQRSGWRPVRGCAG